MKYLFVPVVGPVREVELPDDTNGFLNEAEKQLDCSCVEFVYIPGGHYVMIIDESGKICNPPKRINIRASPLSGGWPSDCIAGDVIIGKRGFVNGSPDIVGLTDKEINDLKKYYRGG